MPSRNQRNLRRVLLICAPELVIYACAAIWCNLNPLQFHRTALCLLVHKPTNRFDADYVLWNLQGRRSFRQVQHGREEHLHALTKLGYFEKRMFQLQQPLDNARLARLLSMVQQWGTEGRFTDSQGQFQVLNHRTELLVAAVPEDMPAWAELVRRLEHPQN